MARRLGYSAPGLIPLPAPVYIRSLSVTAPSALRARRIARGGVAVTMEWTTSIDDVKRAMTEIPKAMLDLANGGMKVVADQSVRNLAANMGGLNSKTLKLGWTAKFLAGGKAIISGPGGTFRGGTMLFAWGITNKDPRAYAPITTRGGSTTDLLEILEYGTRPHRIAANPPKKALSFWWAEEGVQFVGASVNHPGTKPYGFIRISVAQAAADMLVLLAKLRRVRFYLCSTPRPR